jgi:hypothetical protein
MKIQVCYPDDQFDYVNADILDILILSKKIIRFKRSSGWVTIGVDPIRSIGGERAFSLRDRKRE